MSKVNPGEVRYYHGKMSKNDPGYFYVTQKGEQYFRKREEKYQRNQSPRQKWNSLAFGYAHKKIRQLWSSDELIEQVNQEWQNAHKIGPNNRPYPDAKRLEIRYVTSRLESRASFRNLVRTIPRRNIPESRRENCFRGYFRLYASPPSRNPRSTSR